MSQAAAVANLIKYANHYSDCDSCQPMWHKGPCDCGFASVVVQLRGEGYDVRDKSFCEGKKQPPLLFVGTLANIATQGATALGWPWFFSKEAERLKVMQVETACGVTSIVVVRIDALEDTTFRYEVRS